MGEGAQRVRLDHVREEPYRWDEVREVDAGVLDQPELIRLGPVRWRGRIVHAESGYLLSAALSYRQTLACIRCLRPVEVPVDSEIQMLILQREEQGQPGEEVELEEEELDVLTVTGEVVDLEPLFLEQLQLHVPMKPLCRPDCEGICPTCGADLSAGPCDCEPPVDPRWEALGALKSQLAGEE